MNFYGNIAKDCPSFADISITTQEKKPEKDVAKIKQEIRDVIRQITASVTFLPLLDCLCTFDVLIYTPE